MKIIQFIKEVFNKNETSFILFCLGLFLLPSAVSISILLFLISNILINFKLKEEPFKDKIILFFFIGCILLIISALTQSFTQQYPSQYEYKLSLTWLGLANWLPLIWCFSLFKNNLLNARRRRICGLILISGTFPIIVTGIGQAFLNWHGPFQTLNGLITWYQRPIDGITGLTGLFNNPNYAGAWLTIIWPFCLLTFIIPKRNKLKKISAILFSFSISISIILTNSRAAWLGLLIGTIIIYGRKSYKYIVLILLFISLIITSSLLPIFGSTIQELFINIIPNNILMEFSDFQISRIDIWQSGIKYVMTNPLFGSGASSFSGIYQLETGLWKGHSHNLFLELMVSYGIPAGIMIFTPILYVAYKSTKLLIKKDLRLASYDKAWITGLLIFLITQMVDVQYFDARISLVGWILLAGCTNIIRDNLYYEKNI